MPRSQSQYHHLSGITIDVIMAAERVNNVQPLRSTIYDPAMGKERVVPTWDGRAMLRIIRARYG
eukprot:8635124-Pyramimonas_sp.AAC.1